MKRDCLYKRFMVAGVLFLCSFYLLSINTGCRKNTGEVPFVDTPRIDDPPWDQVIVWRKPGATAQQVSEWIGELDRRSGDYLPVTVSRICTNCDNSLMLLSGPRIQTYINGKTVGGGQRPTASAPDATPEKPPIVYGELGPVYLSWNFKIKSNPFPPITVSIPPGVSPQTAFTETPVKVAVFDTGIEPGQISNFLYKSSGTSCIPGAEFGWNFVTRSTNFIDDNSLRHGTTITKLITDQVIQYGKNSLEILPVKTHDEKGIADLYTVLCAFAYAKERGVHIINASFGFYQPRGKYSSEPLKDPNVLLLKKFVDQYLTQNNILLVTAAGNTDNLENLSDFKVNIGTSLNLSQVSFYPASLAEDPDFSNVIAATTVSITNGVGTVSPVQNYSANVVDIGVVADKVTGEHYVFKNPLLQGDETVEGSSYAAAILTGKLSANYFLYKDLISLGSKVQRQAIIQRLSGVQIVSSEPSLQTKIRNGMVMKK